MARTICVLVLTRCMFSLTLKNSEHHTQTGAPNENIVQNHLNIALLNVF